MGIFVVWQWKVGWGVRFASGTLQHDLKPWVIEQKDGTYHRVIAEARKVFGIKDSASDEQVVDFIVKAKPILSERFKGKHLEELFL